jgi:hypothetical protein
MANAFKVLGQVNPAAETNTDLYTVPASTETVISSIIIANLDSSAATYDISIRPNNDPQADKHFIAKGITVGAADSTTLTLGITLDALDVITVQASSINLAFNVFGSEIS